MVKTSLIKSIFSGYGGQNLQTVGRTRKRRARERTAAQKKLRKYRKEEKAFMKRKKKIHKILSDPSALMPKFKNKPLKLNKI